MNDFEEQITSEIVKQTAGKAYQDLLHPTLETVGDRLNKIVKIALSPVEFLYWGYEETKNWIQESVAKKLKDVPEDKIIEPDPIVAVPIIQNIRYSYRHEHLKEMYASLLANSMNKDKANDVVPAFVEVLKQLSPIDALVFEQFTLVVQRIPYINLGFKKAEKDSTYYLLADYVSTILKNHYNYKTVALSFINLSRLGLIDLENGINLSNIEVYKPIESLPIYTECLFVHAKGNEKLLHIQKGTARINEFGLSFKRMTN